MGILFSSLDFEPSPDQPCHVKTAAANLGISVEELRRLLQRCHIKPMDEDHITMRTLDRLRRKLEKIPKIAEECITIPEAAIKMYVSIKTAKRWILKLKRIPAISVREHKVRWRVRLADLLKFIDQPFFTQEIFGMTELAEILRVSPVTINNWKRDGKIEILLSPGGDHVIPFSQVGKCIELAQAGYVQNKYRHI